MTLLEQTYADLHSNNLVNCAEAFSVDYLGKSKHWFAVQRHAGRDFSVGAAIACLRSLRSKQLHASAALTQQQRSALLSAACELQNHLRVQHCISETC